MMALTATFTTPDGMVQFFPKDTARIGQAGVQ